MKYRIVDVDNRAAYSKPKTFAEVKALFEPNAELTNLVSRKLPYKST